MELGGHGQPHRGPGFHPQENEAVPDEQPRRNVCADKDWEQRRSGRKNMAAVVVTSESTKWVLTEIVISFSVPIEALEPHHVSERPWHGHPHRRGDGGAELLQGLPVEARVRSGELVELFVWSYIAYWSVSIKHVSFMIMKWGCLHI